MSRAFISEFYEHTSKIYFKIMRKDMNVNKAIDKYESEVRKLLCELSQRKLLELFRHRIERNYGTYSKFEIILQQQIEEFESKMPFIKDKMQLQGFALDSMGIDTRCGEVNRVTYILKQMVKVLTEMNNDTGSLQEDVKISSSSPDQEEDTDATPFLPQTEAVMKTETDPFEEPSQRASQDPFSIFYVKEELQTPSQA